MRVRFLLFVLLFIFLTNSISTAEEALNQKVHKARHQERNRTSESLTAKDKDGGPILQETKSASPNDSSQPPSAPKGLKVVIKSK